MALSNDSAKIVDALDGYIRELHADWKILIELFGAGQERSDFLNSVSGVFFGTVYKALLRNILLGIGRLTDPLSTLGKDNLVLERLCLLPEVSGDSTLSSEIKTRLNQIKSAASGVREYRNKYLAHLDLPTALGASPEVLPGVKRQDVDKILDGFADLFNLIEQKLRGSHTAFELMAIHDGPDALLTRLEDAEAFRTLPFQERQHLRTEWKKKQ